MIATNLQSLYNYSETLWQSSKDNSSIVDLSNECGWNSWSFQVKYENDDTSSQAYSNTDLLRVSSSSNTLEFNQDSNTETGIKTYTIIASIGTQSYTIQLNLHLAIVSQQESSSLITKDYDIKALTSGSFTIPKDDYMVDFNGCPSKYVIFQNAGDTVKQKKDFNVTRDFAQTESTTTY